MTEVVDIHRIARTQLTVGVLAVVVGLIGYWVSRDVAFSGGSGAIIYDDFELRTMSYNRLGALVTIVFGALGVLAGAWRRPMIGLLGAAGFALLAIQPLVQWRANSENLLAANGRNYGFALALALGLAVPAIVARMARIGADSTGTDAATGSPR